MARRVWCFGYGLGSDCRGGGFGVFREGGSLAVMVRLGFGSGGSGKLGGGFIVGILYFSVFEFSVYRWVGFYKGLYF